MARIIVCGSRNFEDHGIIQAALLEHAQLYDTLVHRNLPGADLWADWLWREHCIDQRHAAFITTYEQGDSDLVREGGKRLLTFLMPGDHEHDVFIKECLEARIFGFSRPERFDYGVSSQ